VERGRQAESHSSYPFSPSPSRIPLVPKLQLGNQRNTLTGALPTVITESLQSLRTRPPLNDYAGAAMGAGPYADPMLQKMGAHAILPGAEQQWQTVNYSLRGDDLSYLTGSTR